MQCLFSHFMIIIESTASQCNLKRWHKLKQEYFLPCNKLDQHKDKGNVGFQYFSSLRYESVFLSNFVLEPGVCCKSASQKHRVSGFTEKLQKGNKSTYYIKSAFKITHIHMKNVGPVKMRIFILLKQQNTINSVGQNKNMLS